MRFLFKRARWRDLVIGPVGAKPSKGFSPTPPLPTAHCCASGMTVCARSLCNGLPKSAYAAPKFHGVSLRCVPLVRPHGFFPQRAAAALWAISWRCSLVRAFARRIASERSLDLQRTHSQDSSTGGCYSGLLLFLPLPPANPARLAISLRSSAVSFLLRTFAPSLPRATAAAFFFLATDIA